MRRLYKEGGMTLVIKNYLAVWVLQQLQKTCHHDGNDGDDDQQKYQEEKTAWCNFKINNFDLTKIKWIRMWIFDKHKNTRGRTNTKFKHFLTFTLTQQNCLYYIAKYKQISTNQKMLNDFLFGNVQNLFTDLWKKVLI